MYRGYYNLFITGYHGTSNSNAEKIVRNQEFYPSRKDCEWLGEGIYFYFSFTDAYYWRESQSVLHSVIKINNTEYLDLDSEKGHMLYLSILQLLISKYGVAPSKDAEKNQCAVMKLLWQQYPRLKVVSASFPTEMSIIKTMLDCRKRRKEFCVRNNSHIKHTYLIRKDDVYD